MDFKEIFLYLIESGGDIHVREDDSIESGMRILHDVVVPYMSESQNSERHLSAVAMLCKATFGYVMRIAASNVITQQEVISSMQGLYERKNHDYGNVWQEELEVLGMEAMRIRMWEKTRRAITILDDPSGRMVSDESAYDTLVDICNYCVMTAMWLVNDKGVSLF